MSSDLQPSTQASEDTPEIRASSQATTAPRSAAEQWDALILRIDLDAALQSFIGPRTTIEIGRFKAIRSLGRGGYGVVLEVLDPELERHVALKLCLARGPEPATALMDEARVLAKLSHPNIIKVLEPGEYEGHPFFVMDLLEGGDARQLLKRKPRPSWEHIVDVYRAAGRGLAAAHVAGLIHSDFKPANILLDRDDQPRVSDFGMAWAAPDHNPVPEPGSPDGCFGTLLYLSPEQLRGEPGDKRSDIRAFCVALWETLERCLPYCAETPEGMLVTTMLDDPQEGTGDTPDHVRDVLRVGLSPDPSDRYATMDALLAKLDELREPNVPDVDALLAELHELRDLAPPSTAPAPEIMARKHMSGFADRGILGLIGGLLIGAAALGILSYSQVPWPWSEAPTQHEPQPKLSDTREPVADMGDPPCLDEGAPFVTDPGVRGVCRLLRGNRADAMKLWKEIYAARADRAKTAPQLLKLASSNAVIARTMLNAATSASDQNVDSYVRWLTAAAKADIELAERKKTAEDFTSTVSQVESIINNIVDDRGPGI